MPPPEFPERTRIVETWFVMLEGSTQEEERTEEELRLLVETGAFHSGNLVYLSGENRWVKAGESPLKHLFALDDRPAVESTPRPEEELTPHELLEQEYRELRATLEESPGALDVMMKLAEVSAKLGDRIMAKKVLRDALDKSPYNERIARLARKLLSAGDLRHIPFLKRQDPFWKDLGGLLQFPFLDKGILHIGITGTILYFTSFIPLVGAIFNGLVYFYLLEVIRSTGAGRQEPPNWEFDLPSLVGLFFRPLLPSLIVFFEVSAVFLFAAFLATEGDGLMRLFNMMAWTVQHPIFFILWAAVSLVYYPAVVMIIAVSDENLSDAIDPRKVVGAMRILREDYIMALAFFAVFSFLLALAMMLLGWIPLVGPWVAHCLGFYGLMISGRVLGLTYRRHLHSFI
jgi:hypothetical protein